MGPYSCWVTSAVAGEQGSSGAQLSSVTTCSARPSSAALNSSKNLSRGKLHTVFQDVRTIFQSTWATSTQDDKNGCMTSASRSDVVIKSARHFAGSVRLPGDKSISHRYAMLGAIAEGETRLTNFSSGADCASTLACMQALGANVVREGGSVTIGGIGTHLRKPAAALDCGNSGSTMRMLSGIL